MRCSFALKTSANVRSRFTRTLAMLCCVTPHAFATLAPDIPPSRESVDITAESDLDHVAESVDKLAAGKSGGKAVVKIAP